MSFGEVDKEFDEKEKYRLLEELGEVTKNTYSTVRVSKVRCYGHEFIQLRVWKERQNGEKFPGKGQNIIIKPSVAREIAEIMLKKVEDGE